MKSIYWGGRPMLRYHKGYIPLQGALVSGGLGSLARVTPLFHAVKGFRRVLRASIEAALFL